MTESRNELPIPADDPIEWALTLGRLAHQRKAREVILLDVRQICSFTEFMLVLSGRSSRQVQSLGEHILRQAKKLKMRPVGREGLGRGHWVLLDYNSVVVHVFLDEIRGYYDLEGLWSDAVRYEWDDPHTPPPLS